MSGLLPLLVVAAWLAGGAMGLATSRLGEDDDGDEGRGSGRGRRDAEQAAARKADVQVGGPEQEVPAGFGITCIYMEW